MGTKKVMTAESTEQRHKYPNAMISRNHRFCILFSL